jgi:hypothetical protein
MAALDPAKRARRRDRRREIDAMIDTDPAVSWLTEWRRGGARCTATGIRCLMEPGASSSTVWRT